mgnify:CR=1 FL=1
MEERRMTVYKGQGAVAISFNATRFGINLSTELDYLVSVCLNATAPPQILLQGRWLERAGFNAGIKLQWTASRGGLSSQRTSRKQIPERDNRQILIFYGEFL